MVDGKLEQPTSLQDGPLEVSIRDAFGLVYSAHKPNEPSDDDVFGAKEPKSIGQSWPMNRSLAAQGLKDRGIEVLPDRMSGSVQLESIDKIGSLDCLRLRGEMTIDSISSAGLPPGFTLDAGSLKSVLRGCVPLETHGLQRQRR